jgi:hypothetical protein
MGCKFAGDGNLPLVKTHSNMTHRDTRFRPSFLQRIDKHLFPRNSQAVSQSLYEAVSFS